MATIDYTVNGVSITENGTEEWTVNGVAVSETQVAAGGNAPTSHLYGPLVGSLGGPV